jgi:hypothetical protein
LLQRPNPFFLLTIVGCVRQKSVRFEQHNAAKGLALDSTRDRTLCCLN